jgi:small-conductance mechanosensitive channel
MTDGTIAAALIGLVVLLGVRAVDVVLHASIHMDTLRTLRVIRDHGEEIVEKATTLVHLGGVFAWLTFATRSFRLYDPFIDTLGFFLALWLGLMFARIARLTLREDVLSRMTLPRGMRETISTTAYYIILLLAFFFAAGAAGFDLTKFTILAGALGVGIGFGLQNIVNNFISGLILLFERPIQIGDTIEIENLVGSVKQIGIRASVVRTFAGAEVIVPNGDLISGRVINWTLSDRLRRIEIYVGVAYGTDPQQVMDILLEQANSHEDTLQHPEPYVLFTGFGECSLDFKLRFWTNNYDRWFFVESEVKLAVNNAVVEAGIEIPFPQRDLHVRSVDEAAGEALAPGGGAAVVKRSKPAPKKE